MESTPCCRTQNVLDSRKSTNTLSQSTNITIPDIKTMDQQQTLFPNLSPTSTLSLEASLAKLFLLLESGEDLKIQEGHCSLKLLGLQGLKDLNIYSLKTSKDCSTTTKGIPLRSSSQRWMNWGTMRNGKCLTARISESRKTGSVCSLSDTDENKTLTDLMCFL